jgi:Tfp pilus assembly protein FimT
MNTKRRLEMVTTEGGMTAAELAIGVAIIGLLSVFMGAELQAFADRVYLDTAVAEVVGDLKYARTLAVREKRIIQVAIDQETPGVTVLRTGEPPQPVAPTRNLSGRGVRAIRSSGGNLLSFSPRGTSATPTTLTLEDRKGAQRVVTVSLIGISRTQ